MFHPFFWPVGMYIWRRRLGLITALAAGSWDSALSSRWYQSHMWSAPLPQESVPLPLVLVYSFSSVPHTHRVCCHILSWETLVLFLSLCQGPREVPRIPPLKNFPLTFLRLHNYYSSVHISTSWGGKFWPKSSGFYGFICVPSYCLLGWGWGQGSWK